VIPIGFSKVKLNKSIMKRRDVLKGIMLPLAVMLAVVLFSCEEGVDYPGPPAPAQGVMIGEEGGVLTAMDGNVEITVPAGALTQPTIFVVHDLLNKSGENTALKPIVIEPFVEFAKPVQLALKYDGCLENGIDVCAVQSILFSIWDDEAAFSCKQSPKVCSFCTVNVDSHAVCMCICQTGVVVTTAEL
jgi:hypothetical protein